MKHICLLAFIACCFSGCVSTALPETVIPERSGEFDMGVSLPGIGVQADAQYAIRKALIVGGAYNFNYGPGPIQYGEVRLGSVLPGGSNMVTAAFGHGKFNLNLGFPTGGTDNSVDRYYGHFHKASLSWNHQHKFTKGIFGFICQFAYYQGTGNGNCSDTYCYDEFYNKRFNGPASLQALMYLRLGQDQTLLLALGGALIMNTKSSASIGDPAFFPNPLLVSVGVKM
jgi:hypothetical protein